MASSKWAPAHALACPPPSPYVRWFKDLRLADAALVGGKTAALGELSAALAASAVRVPNGFALTVDAYGDELTAAGGWMKLHAALDTLDAADPAALARAAAACREIVYDATGSDALRQAVADAYADLAQADGAEVAVAVRSSATAADQPEAGFAGLHESYLNLRGAAAVFEACRRCFASLFTERAIAHRVAHGIDHFAVQLAVGVMRLVRSDRAAAGVMATFDPDSGHPDVVCLTGAYGLGENVVQGLVDPDEWLVHTPSDPRAGRCVLRRSRGAKRLRMALARAGGSPSVSNVETAQHERLRFCLTDAEVLALAGAAITIAEHDRARAGARRPMAIEWAKDGPDGALWIIQAGPAAVAARPEAGVLERCTLTAAAAAALLSGRAVGAGVATGRVQLIRDLHDLATAPPGAVLVAEATRPEWEPLMQTAAAIVTEQGGRHSHAALLARARGVPAVVGAAGATRRLAAGQDVTVACAEGDVGRVHAGIVPFSVTRQPLSALPVPQTPVMVSLDDPDLAFATAMRPNQGVGLARLACILRDQLGAHPMALAHPEAIADATLRAEIFGRAEGYASPAAFAVEKLAEAVATLCAAFAPKPVMLRLADFTSGEFAALPGGAAFEPPEANPLLGLRGAARYAHPAYADGVALECAALRRVRTAMGLTNLALLLPFCRHVAEARAALEVLAGHGLRRGEDGLQIHLMCDIPANVLQIDAFASLFDGFAIGSPELAQLTLGVDGDARPAAGDAGMLELLHHAVQGAHRTGRPIGLCGAAAAEAELVAQLVARGIDTITVAPERVLPTLQTVHAAEQRRLRAAE